MADIGWVCVHRKVQDCWVWNEKPFSKGQAWIDLLLLANHRDKKIVIEGIPTVIERGQFYTSLVKLSNRWGWDRRKTSRFLDCLERDLMLEQKRTPNGTTITLVNYGVYQDIGTPNGTTDGTADGTPNGTSDGTQTTKKQRNKETNIYYADNPELNKAFEEYVSMRKKVKAPMTDRAIELAKNKIKALSGGDDEKAIKIINQSVMNSWKGLFELKEDKEKKQNKFNQFQSNTYDFEALEKRLISN